MPDANVLKKITQSRPGEGRDQSLLVLLRKAEDFPFRVPPRGWNALNYCMARITTPDAVPVLANVPRAEVLVRSDGEYLALFNHVGALRRFERNHPDLTLVPIGTHNPAK